MWIALIIIAVIVVGLIIYVISAYNGLVDLRNRVKNSWSQIDVQLKRRNDLIPNLVETVKGYKNFEQETLEKVIAARTRSISSTGIEEQMENSNQLTAALGHLFAVAEAYPDLKANQNFLSLQDELTNTENKISVTRQFYNDVVMKYQTRIQSFPSNIIAGMFGFKDEPYFETADAEREVPQVKF
ncbi:LemA family protein [Culicoidibacter larvae]|uniref:LemA family protein n=1 Tax=Culicoidibacter larvae TaxID=2579976 RepID=A0A5R8QBG1_9FIRM|nr:LemA family protein [Culicoidibacter larvae]TLG73865.1 LemA family protein [Culicoidibacter larvae]